MNGNGPPYPTYYIDVDRVVGVIINTPSGQHVLNVNFGTVVLNSTVIPCSRNVVAQNGGPVVLPPGPTRAAAAVAAVEVSQMSEVENST